ncbi:MAG: hypothetical protein JWN41_1302, partial [Thermoleophilia bacterium]|nr:hypothetical protein [Thermoleophilia bacterium]
MHGAARRSALLVACCLSLAGCGATGSTPRHDRPPRPTATNDAAGRAQLVPAAQRIDAGGDPDLQPLVLAANSAIAAEYP